MPTTIPSDLIGTAEAATLLRCDQSSVTRMIEEGKLKGLRRGEGERAPWFVSKAEVVAMWKPARRFGRKK